MMNPAPVAAACASRSVSRVAPRLSELETKRWTTPSAEGWGRGRDGGSAQRRGRAPHHPAAPRHPSSPTNQAVEHAGAGQGGVNVAVARGAPLQVGVRRERDGLQRGRVELRGRVLQQFPVGGRGVDQSGVRCGQRGPRVGRRGERVHEDEADIRSRGGARVLDLEGENEGKNCEGQVSGRARALSGAPRPARRARARPHRRPHTPRTHLLRNEVQERFAVLHGEQRFCLLQPHGRAQASVELEHGRLGQQGLGGGDGAVVEGRGGRETATTKAAPSTPASPTLSSAAGSAACFRSARRGRDSTGWMSASATWVARGSRVRVPRGDARRCPPPRPSRHPRHHPRHTPTAPTLSHQAGVAAGERVKVVAKRVDRGVGQALGPHLFFDRGEGRRHGCGLR